jgi:hypothetical protein
LSPKQIMCARPLMAALLSCLVLCGSCGRQPPAPDAAKAEPEEKVEGTDKAESNAGIVTLKPEEVAGLGITASAAAAVRYQAATSGFGVVLGHDVIAQAVADVATAQAVAAQSRAVLARMQRLAGTPGADSTEARENAARQAAVDAAALRLAKAKSSSVLGQNPPWAGREDSKLPEELAEGRAKLVRVTFPLGSVNGRAPQRLWLARLGTAGAGERWTAHGVWDAPADAGVPGRSFFALLQGIEVGEGERLLAWTASGGGGGDSGQAESGILIPSSAVVASDGRYWYYLERQPGEFARTAMDISRPMADGYFVQGGLKGGDLIVTSAAGLLLAREINPSTEAE